MKEGADRKELVGTQGVQGAGRLLWLRGLAEGLAFEMGLEGSMGGRGQQSRWGLHLGQKQKGGKTLVCFCAWERRSPWLEQGKLGWKDQEGPASL